jgi:two-component system cell cycle sensor histidine kinase/response regulator CckA
MGISGRKCREWLSFGSAFSRNLLILSILTVIILPTYNTAFVYPSLMKLFTETMTKDATSIARHFMSMFEGGTSELTKKSFDFKKLEEINALKENFGLAKLKFFSRSGEIIFSTDMKEIGDINTEPYFQEIAAQGKVYSKVVKKDSNSLEHQRMLGDVVETYVPMVKDGVFLGAFEIYYDITERKQSLQRMLLVSFIIVIALALSILLLSAMNVVKEKRRLIERMKAEDEREKLIGELQDALAKVRTLSGLLPICSSCKMIRDNKGYWNRLEVYISEHSEAEFTHGLCPDCMKNLYGFSVSGDTDLKKG